MSNEVEGEFSHLDLASDNQVSDHKQGETINQQIGYFTQQPEPIKPQAKITNKKSTKFVGVGKAYETDSPKKKIQQSNSETKN